MATVIGMTAARGEEIAAEHIDTAAVEAGNLVLTRRNAEEISVALPSMAGEPVASMELWDPVCTQMAGLLSGSRRMKMTEWKAYSSYGGDPISISSPVGSEGFGLTEPGWYQITWKLNVGFVAVTTPLPEYVRLLWNQNSGISGQWDVPVFSGDPSGSMAAWDRTLPGALTTVTTPIFYDEGDAITGGGDNDNYAILAWPGDATLKSGNDGLAQYAVRAIVGRFS